jgi:Mrp family chromosome partitioning ATPase
METSVPGVRVLVPNGRKHRPERRESRNLPSESKLREITIIDSPPWTESSEAFALATASDGVVYVIRQRPQDERLHLRAQQQLDRLGVRILGVVFNQG